MNRLECLGKSFSGSQKQLPVTSAQVETNKPNDKVEKKTATDKPCRSLPARALPRSVQVSHWETQKSGLPSCDVLKTDECSPKEPINRTPRVKVQVQSTAVPDEELKMKDLMKAQPSGSAVTETLLLPGGTTRAPPAAEPLPTNEVNEEEEQTEEEDVEDEDVKAPVELIIEFLRAVMDRDFQLASRLCQMILIYEPDNPEASEFLPLIQKKLLEEQEEEQSTEEEEDDKEEDDDDDDEDEDEDDDSGSDEVSSQSSSCSSSSCPSSSSSDDDEEEEKPGNRHKPCPPSHICP